MADKDYEAEVAYAVQLRTMSIEEMEQDLAFCSRVRGRSREAKIAYELLKRLKEGEKS